jgi:hypothetical protein
MTLPDAAELKKLAKQLQTAPNHSVRSSSFLTLFSLLTRLFSFFQELIGILSILKKDYQVTESLLRVAISFFSLLYTVGTDRNAGKQNRSRRWQTQDSYRKGRRRFGKGNRQEMEARRR